MLTVNHFTVLGAILFAIGAMGVLVRRNPLVMFMGIELMLNAANINLVAFGRYITPETVTGQVFSVFVITLAAAEASVGLALIIAIYRTRDKVNVEEVDLLKF